MVGSVLVRYTADASHTTAPVAVVICSSVILLVTVLYSGLTTLLIVNCLQEAPYIGESKQHVRELSTGNLYDNTVLN
eukprot:18288-Heterococcus_DN1.PRE.1